MERFKDAEPCMCGALIEEMDGGGYSYWLHVKRMRINYDHAAVPRPPAGGTDTLVAVYRDTILTRLTEWGVPSRVWDKGLGDIVRNVAVDAHLSGHAEGHSCSCRDGAS